MKHDEDTLVAFLAGTLPAGEVYEFDAHLLDCETCWAAVREDRAARDALETLREPASPALLRRVRLAVLACPGAASRDGTAVVVVDRRRRSRALAGVLAGAVATAAAIGVLVPSRSGPASDPAPIAAIVELARLQSPTSPAELDQGGGAASRSAPVIDIGHQKIQLAHHRINGRDVLVATSDRAFPMPPESRPLGREPGAPWVARRGDLELACISRPGHMLLVGQLPSEQLVEVGRQLSRR